MIKATLTSSYMALVPCLGMTFLMLSPGGCASSHSARKTPVPESAHAIDENRRLNEAMDLSRRAEDMSRSNRPDEAIDLYRRAVGLVPELAMAWNNLGVLYMEKGNFLDASEACKIAIDLLPRDPRPLENMGLIYHRAGFDSDSLSYYQRALDRDPTRLDALRGAMVATHRLGKADGLTPEQLRTALMLEKDPTWREKFERQRVRLFEFSRMQEYE